MQSEGCERGGGYFIDTVWVLDMQTVWQRRVEVLPCASHRRPAGVQSVDMVPPPAASYLGFLLQPDRSYTHMT